MTGRRANVRRATRSFMRAADIRARDALWAHDGRCNAPAGDRCSCTEWQCYDWIRDEGLAWREEDER